MRRPWFNGGSCAMVKKKVNVYLPSLMMKVKSNPATGLVVFRVLVG
jgi:hypothetical protein